jgi:flagellar protein FliL
MAEGKPEKTKINILSLLRLLVTILAVLVFLITTVSNLVVVYMIFAPDTFPKPFYLYSYDQPGLAGGPAIEGTPAANTSGGSETEGNKSGGTTPGGTTGGGESGVSTGQYLPGQGITLDTGNKIVNLAEPGGRKYIRTNVVLEFAPSNAEYPSLTGEEKTLYVTEFKAELNNILPVVNDSIITLLSSKDFQSVSTSEGKEVLRQQIMEAVNSKLHEYHVIYVYFTEFVYQ